MSNNLLWCWSSPPCILVYSRFLQKDKLAKRKESISDPAQTYFHLCLFEYAFLVTCYSLILFIYLNLTMWRWCCLKLMCIQKKKVGQWDVELVWTVDCLTNFYLEVSKHIVPLICCCEIIFWSDISQQLTTDVAWQERWVFFRFTDDDIFSFQRCAAWAGDDMVQWTQKNKTKHYFTKLLKRSSNSKCFCMQFHILPSIHYLSSTPPWTHRHVMLDNTRVTANEEHNKAIKHKTWSSFCKTVVGALAWQYLLGIRSHLAKQ